MPLRILAPVPAPGDYSTSYHGDDPPGHDFCHSHLTRQAGDYRIGAYSCVGRPNMRRLALVLALTWLIISPNYPAAAQPRHAGPSGGAAASERLVVFEVFMSFG